MALRLVALTKVVAQQRGNARAVEALERLEAAGIEEPGAVLEALAGSDYVMDAGTVRSLFQAGLTPNQLFVRYFDRRELSGFAMQHKAFDAASAWHELGPDGRARLVREPILGDFVQLLPPELREATIFECSARAGAITAHQAAALLSGGVSAGSRVVRHALFHALCAREKEELALRLLAHEKDAMMPFENEQAAGDVMAAPLIVAIRGGSERVIRDVLGRVPEDYVTLIHAALPADAREAEALARWMAAR